MQGSSQFKRSFAQSIGMLSGIPDVASHENLYFHFWSCWNPPRERFHQENAQPPERSKVFGFLPQNQTHIASLTVSSIMSAVCSGDPPTSTCHQRARLKLRNRPNARSAGGRPQKLANSGEIGGNSPLRRAKGRMPGLAENPRKKQTSVSGTTCAAACGNTSPTRVRTRLVPSWSVST